MPKPTADPVADHGAADGAGDHEADLWRGAFAGGRTVATACAVHHEEGGRITWTGPGSAATGAQRRGKVVAAPQPGAGREHAGQAESRERPLARRPARIARPARVRIRRRNPWVLARRRLFGWKVRLLTRWLPYDGLERRQRCLRQGGGPMRPAPVGRPRRNGNQWTAWTHDNGRRDGSTGSRYVRSSRPVKPNRAGNRPGNTTAQPGPATAHRDTVERPRPTRHAAVCPHRGKKIRRVVDNRLLAPLGVGSVALRWETSLPTCLRCRATAAMAARRRWGTLCTQAVDDGVDERHHGTNRALTPRPRVDI